MITDRGRRLRELAPARRAVSFGSLVHMLQCKSSVSYGVRAHAHLRAVAGFQAGCSNACSDTGSARMCFSEIFVLGPASDKR